MRKFKNIPHIAALIILCTFSMASIISAQTGVVEEGEPLHLYLRRQPVQDYTYLYFHPPDVTYQEKAENNLSYRKTFLTKDSGNDLETMFFPQDPKSNFLQFEPNSSLSFEYSFVISAVKPPDPSDLTYILEFLVDIDYDNDGHYDDQLSFEISGDADSESAVKEGTVTVDMDQLKRFDGKRGGRLRVTISRKDDIDTSVTIYCGYQGYNSYFVFPFSKYKYEGEPPDDGGDYWLWILAGAGILIVGGIAYLYIRQKQVEKPPEPDKRRKGARRRR
jgi:hypothetical protein